MTNEELAAAIKFAWECCGQTKCGGTYTSETNEGKTMLAHLKELLAIQQNRAAMMEQQHD